MRLLAAGEHPKVVQEILGHSSVQLTLDTYSHLLLPDLMLKERAAAKLDAILSGGSAGNSNPGQNPGQSDPRPLVDQEKSSDSLGEVVSLTFTSWNLIGDFLRRLDALKRAA